VRVTVTGGSGFIGSHVVDHLLAAGHEVVVVDTHPPHRADVVYRDGDVTDLSTMIKATAGCDAVFHLAAVSDVNDAYADPVGTMEVNVLGTAKVCEASRRNQIQRTILASTVWVYAAAPGDGPLGEDTPLVSTQSAHVYTASKVAAELVVSSFGELYGLPYTILRYGIPFGPRMRRELVIPCFLQSARADGKLTIHGDGLQFRNYLYVADLAAAHVLALSPVGARQVFNLEGPEAVSIRRIAELARDLIDPDVEIEFIAARPGDYAGREVSRDKAARLLGWTPQVPFEEGMRRYVEWWLAEEDPIERASTA
jgi:UDP-glucose 4-epimerase